MQARGGETGSGAKIKGRVERRFVAGQEAERKER